MFCKIKSANLEKWTANVWKFDDSKKQNANYRGEKRIKHLSYVEKLKWDSVSSKKL